MKHSLRCLLPLAVFLLCPAQIVCDGQSEATCSANDETCASPNTNDTTSMPPTNLYQDTADMLNVAMHTYGYACLQDMAQKHQDSFKADADSLASILINNMTSISSKVLVSFARSNMDAIKKLNSTKPDELSLECSVSIHHLWDETQSHWEEGRVSVAIDTEDERKELVYGIAVDNLRKRIIVSFRGSETTEDWIRNSGINFETLPNPHYDANASDQPRKIALHTGFHDYLLKKRYLSKRQRKYDLIKHELSIIIPDYPDYDLYVTGHSLGGALSSIFAFYIASENDMGIKHPVTLINFAAPLVGDKKWQSAFQEIEKDGKVRHLRVSVLEDLVPTQPQSPASPLQLFMKYKHTGTNLKLNANSTFELIDSYTLKKTGPTKDTKWFWECLPWHTLGMYDFRLDDVAEDLKTKQLSDLW